MTMRLTQQDQQGLAGVLQVLLTPLDYDDMDAWRADVTTQMAALFHAGRGYFAMPLSETKYVYPEHFSSSVLQTYPQYIRQFNKKYGTWRRAVALGVHTRRSLFAPCWDEVSQDLYMQEFIPAIRGYSSACASVLLRAEDAPGADTVAQIVVHYDAPQPEHVTRHSVGLMQLLYPAFTSGLRTFVHLHGYRDRLARMVDALGLSAMLCGAGGTVLHQTPRLSACLAAEPSREELRAAIRRLAASLLPAQPPTQRSGHRATTAGLENAPFQVVRAQANTYHMQGCLLPVSLAPVPAVLVTLAPLRPTLPSVHALRDRYDLTPQQARVALLLARRYTNREIAAALHVSEHTARHHVEAVLAKLGLSSRRAVRNRLVSPPLS